MCRIGHALLWWSLDFGFIGMGVAVAVFVLGVISMAKGRGGYGAAIVVGSFIAPITNIALMSSMFTQFYLMSSMFTQF